MVSSLQTLLLAISPILCCCAPSPSAAAVHRDLVAINRQRRSQRGVNVTAAHLSTTTCSTYVTRHRGGGGGGGGGGVHQDNQKSEESFLKRHPFASAVAITTCNAVAADLFTQLIVQSKPIKDFDMQRTILLGTFGLLFQGCAQYTVVNVVWERLFPGTSPKSVVAKTLGMNLLSDPLLFFPCFYIFQTFLEHRRLAIGAAMERYAQNYWTDWKNSWMVWFPGHLLTYGVMPPHRRIPWMAFLSFFYMCILSFTRGGGAD